MKTKTCKACEFYQPVYSRGYWYWMGLIKPNRYFCTECEQIMVKENNCEKWQSKTTKIDITPQRLKEVEEDIKALIELLADNS